MKKYFICLTLLLVLFFPASVFAHVLITDGNIGAVLHIDPEDDPIVGQQASFFFEFKDKATKFKPEQCACVVTISENGKVLFTQPLFQNNTDPSLSSASLFFTFPERNIYQLKVIGKPNSSGDFQPFTLTYDLRVSRTADNQSTQNPQPNWFAHHVPHLIVGFIVLGFFIFALINQKKDSTS